jgi:hypothetical protein
MNPSLPFAGVIEMLKNKGLYSDGHQISRCSNSEATSHIDNGRAPILLELTSLFQPLWAIHRIYGPEEDPKPEIRLLNRVPGSFQERTKHDHLPNLGGNEPFRSAYVRSGQWRSEGKRGGRTRTPKDQVSVDGRAISAQG